MEENPPTKDESSAEAEHAPEEPEARLRQLAEDYRAAFHRNPTEEGWRMAQLLYAIGEAPHLRHPLRLGRAVLRGLGMTKDDAKDLLRRDQWEAWLREHGEP